MSDNGLNQAIPAQTENNGLQDTSQPVAPSNEHATTDSRNAAERQVSIGHKHIGPLKTKITNRAKNALVSLDDIVTLTEQAGRTNVIDDDQYHLADTTMYQAQSNLFELQAVKELIVTTFAIPLIAQHEDRIQNHEEIMRHCEERNVEERASRLHEAIETLKALYSDRGREFTVFVPTTKQIEEAKYTIPEEPLDMDIETSARRPGYPLSNSSGSFRPPGSGISEMYYDESQTDHTVTALINAHTTSLRNEINRGRDEWAEKERLYQDQMLQLKEQIVFLNKQRLQENSLRNELNRADIAEQAPMASTRTPRGPSEPTPILRDSSIPVPPAAAPTPPVRKTIAREPRIPETNRVLSSKPPQPTTTISTSELESMRASIARLEQLQLHQHTTNNEEVWDKEVVRGSNQDSNNPSRATRPLIQLPKTTRSDRSALTPNEFSDGEKSRIGPSGSEFENDEEYRPPSHKKKTKTSGSSTKTLTQPKLNTVLSLLPKFDGTGDWEDFRDTFYADIMSRDDIRPSHQFAILQEHLIGSARCCTARMKDHSAAIKATFKNIGKAYGESLTTDMLMQRFNKMTVHQTDPQQMREDLVKISSLHMLLREKGIPDTDDRLTKGLASKLPLLLREGARGILRKKRGQTTVDDIIDQATDDIGLMVLDQEFDELRTNTSVNEIPTNASILYTNDRSTSGKNKPGNTPVYQPNRVKTTFFDHVTKTTLPGHYAPGRGLNIKSIPVTFPFDNKEPYTCAACSKEGHSPLRCKDKSSEFRANVDRKKLCQLCLSPDHAITNCKSSNACIYCGGMHHTGGCPLKEFYRDTANYPADAKPRQQFFRPRPQNGRAK